MSEPIRFKKRFRPRTVEIEDKAEAIHRFQTVPLTRSVERELAETMERVKSFSEETTDEEALDVVLNMIDKMVEPGKGKRTKASSILKALWKDEEIESLDIVDFLNDLAINRRPT